MVSNEITILIIFLVLVGLNSIDYSWPFYFSKELSESTESESGNSVFYRCLYQLVSYETAVMIESLSISLNISLDKTEVADCYEPEFYITICSKIICQTSFLEFQNEARSNIKTFNANQVGY